LQTAVTVIVLGVWALTPPAPHPGCRREAGVKRDARIRANSYRAVSSRATRAGCDSAGLRAKCFPSFDTTTIRTTSADQVPPRVLILLAVAGMGKIPIDLGDPDLVVSLDLDPFAPRAARHHVAQVDRPSPDLRNAVMLLTSELVTRAAQQCQSSLEEAVELRVWMPADVVRVELRAPRYLLSPPRDDAARYGEMFLRQVADRWSIDTAQDFACMWFEIERHEARGELESERD
jgi:hypothetical protein